MDCVICVSLQATCVRKNLRYKLAKKVAETEFRDRDQKSEVGGQKTEDTPVKYAALSFTISQGKQPIRKDNTGRGKAYAGEGYRVYL
jgi:hypothetical protein